MIDIPKGGLLEKAGLILNFLRCCPHLIMFHLHKNRSLFQADTRLWLQKLEIKYGMNTGFLYLLTFHREFRNLFYARIGASRYILNIFCPKLPTLFIGTKEIGEGLFISYGISTAIGAKSIGKNCTISQQVTIGANTMEQTPVLLDNVIVLPGAIIIGNITIGNNVVIGANATVYRDILDNCKVTAADSRVISFKPEADKETG